MDRTLFLETAKEIYEGNKKLLAIAGGVMLLVFGCCFWMVSTRGVEAATVSGAVDLLDFTDRLGFRIAQWPGVPVRVSRVLSSGTAEVKIPWDKDNLAYLRIAKDDGQTLEVFSDPQFEKEADRVVGETAVSLGYRPDGPVQARWEKEGHLFLLYQKKGETTLSEEEFLEYVEMYLTGVVLE